MSNCIFCRIINREVPGYIVYEDNQTIVLLDIFPSTDGHLLAIPKRHAETILDYSEKELGKTLDILKKIIKALEKTYQTQKFTIGINHGEEDGVPHLHIHCIPRYKGDKGGIIQSIVKNKTKTNFSEVLNSIKKNLVA